jgi:hypothetical protein
LFDAVHIVDIAQGIRFQIWLKGPAARRQRGLDIARIGEIDSSGAITFVVNEKLARNGGWIDQRGAESRGSLLMQRDIDKEPVHRLALLASPEIVEPD